MKWTTLLMAFALTTTTAFGAGAKSKDHQKAEFLKKELNLTDEQLEKVKEIRKGKKDDMKASKDNFKKTKKAFLEAMENPEASREELTAKFEAFQKLREDFQRKRFAMMLEMRSILNPEQMKKFREMKRKHPHHGKRKGHCKE